MATGRKTWTRRLLLLAAITMYALLAAAGIFPNPFPALWDWIDQDRPLAPDLVWQDRLDSRPTAAGMAAGTVAVGAGNRAELRDRETGAQVGSGDPTGWPAEWVLVAGEGGSAVVITSERFANGYQVRDPATGRVLYEDEDALAVWAYRDARLDLQCDNRRACRLRAFQPDGETPEWTTDLPGRRMGMLGANPQLAAARMADPSRIDAGAAGPVALPRLLGIPVERRGGDAVVVLETGAGQVQQVLEPGDHEKIMVVGDRVVSSEVIRQHGVCVGSATGYDAVTGAVVWGPQPYYLWTSGSGCEQRNPPLSAGAAMSVVGADGRPVVLDAYDGRVLWAGEAAEQVVALSPALAVIRGADDSTLYAVRLGDNGEASWERSAEPDAEVLVAPCGIVVSDRDPSRVYVWDPDTGEVLLSVPTTARVLACTPEGLVLAGGRSIGFADFDGDGDAPRAPGEADPPLDSK